MPPSDAAEGAQRIKMIRNVLTPMHMQCVCGNVTLLNQAKITKDGFENHSRLHKFHCFLIKLMGLGFFWRVGYFWGGGRRGGFLFYVEPSLEVLNEKHARLNSANTEMRIVAIIILSWLI